MKKKMRCAVFGCKNNKKKIGNKNRDLNFYLFPKKDPDLCEKWVEFCRRPKCFYLKSARICGDHFRDKDKERNIKYEMGFEKAYCPKLRQGAVPCIYKEKDEIIVSKQSKKLASFPTVMLEDDSELSQQSLNESGNDNDPDKDPLAAEEFKKKLNIALLKRNEQQTLSQAPIVDSSNERADKPQHAFKGILAVLYPVDEPGKALQGTVEQSVKNQGVDVSPIQATTLSNEDFLQQIKKLKSENDKLMKNEKMYKNTIKSLENKLIRSNFQRDSLEEKLKTIFTKTQIRRMITGKRVIWSEEDMAKALKLYNTSSAAYRMLKCQNYPIPSQKSVQVWMQMCRREMESITLERQLQNSIPVTVNYNSETSENYSTGPQ